MDKYELYHIHKNDGHNKLWEENKIIKVSDNFKSNMAKRYNDFSTCIKLESGMEINFYDYMLGLVGTGEIFTLNKNEIMALSDRAYQISYYANFFKRESALEKYRLDKFNSLPSRLHSVYLTDEDGIGYWTEILGGNDYSLFRVEATGNIFKTNEELLPNEVLSYADVYDNSYNYWHPKFNKLSKYKNEYLVQGSVKVLEKIR